MSGKNTQKKAEARERQSQFLIDDAKRIIDQREWERQQAEGAISWGFSQLGSQQHLSGDPSFGKEADYMGGYFAPSFVDKYQGGLYDPSSKGRNQGLYMQTQQAYDAAAAQANDLLRQAQEAAAAGDYTLADQLKSQADSVTAQAQSIGKWWWQAGDQPMVPDYTNPAAAMREHLQSPMGMTIGHIVNRGREYVDPDSAQSQRLYQEIRDPLIDAQKFAYQSGVSQLASQRRQTEAQLEQSFASQGAGRNLQVQRAAQAAVARAYAQDAADMVRQREYNIGMLTSQANTFLEQYRNQYAASSVDIGMAFVRNAPFANETFQGNMDQLAAASASMYAQLAQYNAALSNSLHGMAVQQDASGSGKFGKVMQGLGALISVAGIVAAPFTGGASLLATGAGTGLMSGGGGLGGSTGAGSANFASGYSSYQPFGGPSLNMPLPGA